MPRISVVVITARPGGIDVLLTGLSRQEFSDFEVVLVDALYDRRAELVADAFHDARIPLIHTPPRERVFPYDACPQARNTAIAKANGELLVWFVDYTFALPKCLAEHWAVYECTRGERVGAGAHSYLFPPPLAYSLPDYAPLRHGQERPGGGMTYSYDEVKSRRYVDDLLSGFYDKYMFSIFKDSISTKEQIHNLRQDIHFYNADPKITGIVGSTLDGIFFHGKNEATTLASCVHTNGFAEMFTGHLWDDTDMGKRLDNAGTRWLLMDAAAWVEIVNPRHLFPHIIIRTAIKGQDEIARLRREDTALTESGNMYSIRSMRQMGGWWY